MKRISLLLLVPVLAFSACGSGDSPEDQVKDVANQIIQAESPDEVKEVCSDLLTTRFLKEVYGGEVGNCTDQPLNDEEDVENPGEVSVDSVTVGGDSADARIVTVGGDTDGNDGTWTFTRTGGDWKLDRLGDDFLRSAFTVSVREVDEGVFSYEPMRACMTRQVAKLDSREIRRFMNETLRGDRKEALNDVLGVAKRCPTQMAGYVADELATQVLAKKDVTAGQIRCARKKLVPLLEISGLSSMAIRPDAGTTMAYALAGLISGVMKQCPAGAS